MRIAVIGCMVMNREVSHLVAESRHTVRVWWLRQGLHLTPDILRTEIQRTIDEIERENGLLPEQQRYQAIILAYGLCSNGVIGLRSRSVPLVVPRCDDCISLFLGSADRYRKLFREMQGVYWYNRGWIEQAVMPSKENYAIQRAEYAAEFGEENADYLMECTNNWMTKYQSCGYITCPLGDSPDDKAFAKQAAADFGWEYREVAGSMDYLDPMINGPWDDARFLTCPPGSRIEADFSNRKFRSVPVGVDDLESGDANPSESIGYAPQE